MIMPQTPVAGIQILRPKSGRKPLLPINNIPANIPIEHGAKPNPKPSEKEMNKENQPGYVTPTKDIGLADASLAEELSAIRKKLERTRLDKEKTEEMLARRDEALGVWMKQLEQRGQAQKMLEIQVDRLFRLKELKFMRVSPIRSLRDKEGEKKIKGAQMQDIKAEEIEGSVDESALQSQISESSKIITKE